jgi:hypothetical protein
MPGIINQIRILPIRVGQAVQVAIPARLAPAVQVVRAVHPAAAAAISLLKKYDWNYQIIIRIFADYCGDCNYPSLNCVVVWLAFESVATFD